LVAATTVIADGAAEDSGDDAENASENLTFVPDPPKFTIPPTPSDNAEDRSVARREILLRWTMELILYWTAQSERLVQSQLLPAVKQPFTPQAGIPSTREEAAIMRTFIRGVFAANKLLVEDSMGFIGVKQFDQEMRRRFREYLTGTGVFHTSLKRLLDAAFVSSGRPPLHRPGVEPMAMDQQEALQILNSGSSGVIKKPEIVPTVRRSGPAIRSDASGFHQGTLKLVHSTWSRVIRSSTSEKEAVAKLVVATGNHMLATFRLTESLTADGELSAIVETESLIHLDSSALHSFHSPLVHMSFVTDDDLCLFFQDGTAMFVRYDGSKSPHVVASRRFSDGCTHGCVAANVGNEAMFVTVYGRRVNVVSCSLPDFVVREQYGYKLPDGLVSEILPVGSFFIHVIASTDSSVFLVTSTNVILELKLTDLFPRLRPLGMFAASASGPAAAPLSASAESPLQTGMFRFTEHADRFSADISMDDVSVSSDMDVAGERITVTLPMLDGRGSIACRLVAPGSSVRSDTSWAMTGEGALLLTVAPLRESRLSTLRVRLPYATSRTDELMHRWIMHSEHGSMSILFEAVVDLCGAEWSRLHRVMVSFGEHWTRALRLLLVMRSMTLPLSEQHLASLTAITRHLQFLYVCMVRCRFEDFLLDFRTPNVDVSEDPLFSSLRMCLLICHYLNVLHNFAAARSSSLRALCTSEQQSLVLMVRYLSNLTNISVGPASDGDHPPPSSSPNFIVNITGADMDSSFSASLKQAIARVGAMISDTPAFRSVADPAHDKSPCCPLCRTKAPVINSSTPVPHIISCSGCGNRLKRCPMTYLPLYIPSIKSTYVHLDDQILVDLPSLTALYSSHSGLLNEARSYMSFVQSSGHAVPLRSAFTNEEAAWGRQEAHMPLLLW
jgi:hypothetical protein